MSESKTVSNNRLNELPEQNYLLECFRYDEETGKLYWKERPRYHFDSPIGAYRSNRYFNKEAGSLTNGYLLIRLDGKRYQAHRVIWMIVKGTEPNGFIDHINGNKLDNIIENLRDVSCGENNVNRHKLRKDNTTGYLGVVYLEITDTYHASIQYCGKSISIGRYKYLEEAALAYQLKYLELYGEEFYYANEKNKILLEELKTKAENLKTTILLPKIRSTVTNKLGYNGVEQTKGGRFRASLAKQGCGCFDTVEEAALAYEYKLIEVYGRDHYSYSNRDEILNDLEEKMKVIKLGRL